MTKKIISNAENKSSFVLLFPPPVSSEPHFGGNLSIYFLYIDEITVDEILNSDIEIDRNDMLYL